MSATRAKVTVHIEFETEIYDDPEAYEGAETLAARVAKEQDYLAEDGDYLLQALQALPHRINVKVVPINEGGCGGGHV